MKIALNGQKILEETPAGAENYTINLIKALAQTDTENTYTIYLTQTPPPERLEELTGNNPNFAHATLKKYLSWTHLSLAAELLKNPPNVYFTAVHTIPLTAALRKIIKLFFPRFAKTKIIAMIHGLEYTYSAQYQNPVKRLFQAWPIKFTAKHADTIITPSQATKQAILAKNWGVSPQKITVIAEGVGGRFYQRSDEEVVKIKEKYDLTGAKYFLFVSTIQPRKNLPNTIAGFAQSIKELGTTEKTAEIGENPSTITPKLVVCGKRGWLFAESLAAPRKHGIEKDVLFSGRVPDGDLPALLSGATAFINLSFEEGFGLPLLEAMACETPCIVSDIPAYREMGEGVATFVDPHDTQEIKNAFTRAFIEPTDKEKAQIGLQRAKEYTWEKTAQETLAVFQKGGA